MSFQLPAEPTMPMPGKHFHGGRRVVASCVFRDLLASDQPYKQAGDTWPDLVYLVLLLNPQPPFYTVAYIDPVSWEVLESEDFPNIVPATAHYNEVGGCW